MFIFDKSSKNLWFCLSNLQTFISNSSCSSASLSFTPLNFSSTTAVTLAGLSSSLYPTPSSSTIFSMTSITKRMVSQEIRKRRKITKKLLANIANRMVSRTALNRKMEKQMGFEMKERKLTKIKGTGLSCKYVSSCRLEVFLPLKCTFILTTY